MNQFAQDPNPFGTQQAQQPNVQMPAAANQGGQPPSAQGNIPTGQMPQPAQAANAGNSPPVAGAAGNGLVDGILGAVGSVASAAMQGRK